MRRARQRRGAGTGRRGRGSSDRQQSRDSPLKGPASETTTGDDRRQRGQQRQQGGWPLPCHWAASVGAGDAADARGGFRRWPGGPSAPGGPGNSSTPPTDEEDASGGGSTTRQAARDKAAGTSEEQARHLDARKGRTRRPTGTGTGRETAQRGHAHRGTTSSAAGATATASGSCRHVSYYYLRLFYSLSPFFFYFYLCESTESIRLRRNVRKPMLSLWIDCYLCGRQRKSKEKQTPPR